MFENQESAYKFSALCTLVGLFGVLYGIFLLQPFLIFIGFIILGVGMHITFVYIDSQPLQLETGAGAEEAEDEDDE